MATTYTKNMKELTVWIFTPDGSSDITVADTPEDARATRALGQFLKGETMVVSMNDPVDGVTYIEIPFHAVDCVEVTDIAVASFSKSDPYCSESEGGDDKEQCSTLLEDTLEFTVQEVQGIPTAVANIGGEPSFDGACTYKLTVGSSVFTGGQAQDGATVIFGSGDIPDAVLTVNLEFQALNVIIPNGSAGTENVKIEACCSDSGGGDDEPTCVTMFDNMETEFIEDDGDIIGTIEGLALDIDTACEYELSVGDAVFTKGHARVISAGYEIIFYDDNYNLLARCLDNRTSFTIYLNNGEAGTFNVSLQKCCSNDDGGGDNPK